MIEGVRSEEIERIREKNKGKEEVVAVKGREKRI